MVCIFHFITYTDRNGSLFPAGSWLVDLGNLGVNGVFIFFVISGFVIPLSLTNDRFHLKHIPRFLLRRFIRIEIPYVISILLILLVTFVFSIKNHTEFTLDARQFLLHIVYLIPFSSFDWYNVIYWTLAIEFQFYMVVALLYFFLSSNNKILLFAGVLLFGLSGFMVQDARFIFSYSTIFVQGIVCFLIKTQRMDQLTGFILLLASAVAAWYLHSLAVALFSLGTACIILFVHINTWFTKVFGDISYSLYLTHGLVGMNILYLFSRYLLGFPTKIGLVALALCGSILFSYVYWWAIENPSRQLSKKIRP
jgi:peptidoglycan/LPS O-acetylase OafA/YrhL